MNAMTFRHPPIMAVLQHVPPTEVTQDDIDKLEWAASWGWDGSSVFRWAQDIWAGNSWLWRAGDGVVLTSRLDAPDAPVLFLDAVAGRDMIRLGPAIAADLRAIARYHGCARIECSSRRAGAGEVLKSVGFAPVATHYALEVS